MTARSPQSDDDDTVARSKRTNAITHEDIRNSPGVSIAELLQRIPGVQASQNINGGLSVQIRGGSSMMLSNEPLFVIDGIPVQNVAGNVLLGVNVQDIETIEVLKDVSETSMYGVRGSNGVIVITRKRAGS